MIPVTLANEPADFDDKVRQPGLSAIDELVGREPRKKRRGRKRQSIATDEENIPADKFPEFWVKAIPDMCSAYNRLCAFLSLYIPPGTGTPTIDHMIPKSKDWRQVYEWSNYRLCAAIINSNKGDKEDILDPFEIEDNWFALEIHTGRVTKGPCAPHSQTSMLDSTLEILNKQLCIDARNEYIAAYRTGSEDGGISLSYLKRRAPFIAAELERQEQLAPRDRGAYARVESHEHA